MIALRRTVRFCITGRPDAEAALRSERSNTFAAWPSMSGLGRFYEVTVEAVGRIDPRTGMFLNIKEIDEAVRATIVPRLERAAAEERRTGEPVDPTGLMPGLFEVVNEALEGRVRLLTWNLTPHHALEFGPAIDLDCVVRQQFEFAASHRLHQPDLSEEENRRLYGKCNHANGHGHNYRVEVALRRSPAEDGGRFGRLAEPFDLAALERLVDDEVISRFDHKYLNVDCPEFADAMPSVENIALVCFDLLREPLRRSGMVLDEVTVWETEKTSCTVRRSLRPDVVPAGGTTGGASAAETGTGRMAGTTRNGHG